MAWPNQKVLNKICERANCQKPFSTYFKVQKFCSGFCAKKDRPQGPPVTIELLKEADTACLYSGSKVKYLATKLGCSTSYIIRKAKALGFKWSPRVRAKNLKLPGRPERIYVKKTGCVICGEMRKPEACHIIPKPKGGPGTMENIVPLCPTHHRCYDWNLLTTDESNKLVAYLAIKFANAPTEVRMAASPPARCFRISSYSP